MVIVAVWVHVLAAVTWIGGSLFLSIVLVPALRQPGVERGMDLVHRVARRFRWVAWACVALLIVTGMFNVLVHGGMSGDPVAMSRFWSSAYGMVLVWKLALVGLMLALTVLHDFVLGPRATRAWREVPASRGAVRLRFAVRWMGRLTLLLGVLVIGLGVALARGWPG